MLWHTLQDKMIHWNQCLRNSRLPKTAKKLNLLKVCSSRCYLPENNTEDVKMCSSIGTGTSAVTIFLDSCVTSILIPASVIPISIFRFWFNDFRFFNSNISVYSIQGFDIWFLARNWQKQYAFGLFSVSIWWKNLKYLKYLNPHN